MSGVEQIRRALELGKEAEYARNPPCEVWEDADAALKKLAAEGDSLRLELEAERHVHRKDNEYLVAENERLREALKGIVAIDLAKHIGAPFLAALEIAREALAEK